MNHTDHSQPWPQPEHMEMPDIDFSSFLDIGDIGNLDVSDFPSLGGGGGGGEAQPRMGTDPSVHDFGADNFELPAALNPHNFNGVENQSGWPPRQAQQQHNNIYRPPNHVPPTPNSYELQGSTGRYMQPQVDPATGAFLDQQCRMGKSEAMAFTPLVSPAVTPQDSHFHSIPEYAIPGAYFSPLTSPALQAQQQHHHHQGPGRGYAHSQYTNPTTANSSVATSPLDLNVDVESMKDIVPLPEPPRRNKRKTQAPHSASPTARIRHSPIVKAQRRRPSNLSSIIPPHEVNNLLLEAQAQAQSQAQAQGSIPQPSSAGYMHSHDHSSPESISPEALPDAVMGPPPRPGSTYHSPALRAQNHSAPASTSVTAHQGPGGAPATPASLMSIKKSQQLDIAPAGSGHVQFQSQDHAGMLEDLALPPAAAPARPALDKLDTSIAADTTPRLAPAARNTPKLAPSRGGVSVRSNTSSPSISANQSPAIASTPSFSGKRLDSKQAQAKKRGSISTSAASPAIRPKISPSIKPLLPEGANLTQSQQALLLASKSNYTHLLEGTRLPGVSYPESLSMGLTSKRTSHKLAEQGRRNRINEALKEMQTLLPKSKGKGKASGDEAVAEDDDDGRDGSSKSAEGRSASSKAATVESAINYIKLLQQEKVVAVQMLKQKDEEMAQLMKRLQNAEMKSGPSSIVSEDDADHAETERMEGVTSSQISTK